MDRINSGIKVGFQTEKEQERDHRNHEVTSETNYVPTQTVALGGVMIWEPGQDHTAGVLDPLLQAVKQALATPGSASIQLRGNDVSLAWSGAALGSYRVEWSSNLAQGGWNTLLLANMPGAGGPVQITDFGVVTNHCRCFYRVQTPP